MAGKETAAALADFNKAAELAPVAMAPAPNAVDPDATALLPTAVAPALVACAP